jgi:protein phosphatase
MRALRGRQVSVGFGLGESLAELAMLPGAIRSSYEKAMADYIDSLVSHYLLDDGKLVVAHAGMKESMQGRGSAAVRDFALFGETTGETDEFGLPVRHNWAAEYRGSAKVVYGHTPVPSPEWLNGTIDIDTGCVFGGSLTALRYPEMELIAVPARRVYAEPIRPIAPPAGDPLTAQQRNDELLDITDVTGKRIIETGTVGKVTIREEESIAALEAMSRFAADPRWLIYLPPTISPAAPSTEPGLLEHPAEAFAYYRGRGVRRVVCEEKHMGSRAVVVLCRDAESAERRFGVREGNGGICYTRTGRPFFEDAVTERELLEGIRDALTRAGFWEELATDWVALDCELMPWSAKARDLLRGQYAAVGAASRIGLDETMRALGTTAARGGDVAALIEEYGARGEMAAKFTDAYRRYCWPVVSVADLRLAPFHILATEGRLHTDRDHLWHMETIGSIVEKGESPMLQRTRYLAVDLEDEASVAEGTAWWTTMTENGGEGMVVKPLDFITRNGRDLVQPAIKCRGAEYLRIIYGPEYSTPGHLAQLRSRNLSLKRSLAAREFALGIEALARFVGNEPLRRVHECVFGVLALESDPVDPRL